MIFTSWPENKTIVSIIICTSLSEHKMIFTSWPEHKTIVSIWSEYIRIATSLTEQLQILRVCLNTQLFLQVCLLIKQCLPVGLNSKRLLPVGLNTKPRLYMVPVDITKKEKVKNIYIPSNHQTLDNLLIICFHFTVLNKKSPWDGKEDVMNRVVLTGEVGQ